MEIESSRVHKGKGYGVRWCSARADPVSRKRGPMESRVETQQENESPFADTDRNLNGAGRRLWPREHSSVWQRETVSAPSVKLVGAGKGGCEVQF